MTEVDFVDRPDVETANDSRSLTPWSIVTVGLAIPVWLFVGSSALMSRNVDGGGFLSVVGGIRRGLPLYSGLSDNKDPVFYLAMLAASAVSDAGPFVMDWLWIPLAAVGTWLLARALMSADRALLVAVVVVPLLLIGPFYIAGFTTTPATALVLLTLGLALQGRSIAAGIVLGLLAFIKLVIWPIGLACMVALLLVPRLRRVAVRALLAAVATMGVVAALLAVAGWLLPYLDTLQRNSSYASEALAYFYFDVSPVGHLTKLAGEWQPQYWTAAAGVGLIAVLFAATWIARPGWRTPERGAMALWLPIAVVGTAGMLALTYIWPHHAQVVYLPSALAIIAFAALIPERWPYIAWLGIVIVVAWAVSGVGNPAGMTDRFQASLDTFSVKWSQIEEVPTDARLVNSVPMRQFTFARLGTNDDRGFLASLRDGATLACPEFQLYDFSPPGAFARTRTCLESVDVVIRTDNFTSFAKGLHAADVKPIQDYMRAEFTCLRINDRELCTRIGLR